MAKVITREDIVSGIEALELQKAAAVRQIHAAEGALQVLRGQLAAVDAPEPAPLDLGPDIVILDGSKQ